MLPDFPWGEAWPCRPPFPGLCTEAQVLVSTCGHQHDACGRRLTRQAGYNRCHLSSLVPLTRTGCWQQDDGYCTGLGASAAAASFTDVEAPTGRHRAQSQAHIFQPARVLSLRSAQRLLLGTGTSPRMSWPLLSSPQEAKAPQCASPVKGAQTLNKRTHPLKHHTSKVLAKHMQSSHTKHSFP